MMRCSSEMIETEAALAVAVIVVTVVRDMPPPLMIRRAYHLLHPGTFLIGRLRYIRPKGPSISLPMLNICQLKVINFRHPTIVPDSDLIQSVQMYINHHQVLTVDLLCSLMVDRTTLEIVTSTGIADKYAVKTAGGLVITFVEMRV